MITIKVISALVILFSLNFAASAAEQDKTDSGQRKPDQAQAEAKPDAKPEKCVSETSGFRNLNGVNEFFMEVTSACEKPQRCTINAYVVGSRGGKTGQGMLTLGKASV